MRKFAKHTLMTAATVTIIAGAAPSAYAGNGVLANVFIRPFSPKLADVVDEAHARMGNPIDHAANAIQLTDDQLRSLNALKAASSQASDVLKSSCSSEVSMTPLGRIDTVQKRLDGMIQGWGMIRAPLDDFYNSLNDEQRQRFAALGAAPTARTARRGSASGDNLAALCSSRTESFT